MSKNKKNKKKTILEDSLVSKQKKHPNNNAGRSWAGEGVQRLCQDCVFAFLFFGLLTKESSRIGLFVFLWNSYAFFQSTAVEMSLAVLVLWINLSRSLKITKNCTSRSLKIGEKVHFQGLPFCLQSGHLPTSKWVAMLVMGWSISLIPTLRATLSCSSTSFASATVVEGEAVGGT